MRILSRDEQLLERGIQKNFFFFFFLSYIVCLKFIFLFEMILILVKTVRISSFLIVHYIWIDALGGLKKISKISKFPIFISAILS